MKIIVDYRRELLESRDMQTKRELKKHKPFSVKVINDDGHLVIRSAIMVDGKRVLLHSEYSEDDLWA